MTRWATPSSVIQDSGSIYKNRYRNNAKLQTYKTEGFSLIGNAKKILYFLPVILLTLLITLVLPNITTNYTLAIDKIGSGTITSSPAGINCNSDCSEDYDSGTEITLVATADDGWVSRGTTCEEFADLIQKQLCELNKLRTCELPAKTYSATILMDQAKTVTFAFEQGSILEVTKTGSGTVTSSSSGISCGYDCKEYYPLPTMVTLTATSAIGATFLG